MKFRNSKVFVFHLRNKECPSKNLISSFLNNSNAFVTFSSPPITPSTKKDERTHLKILYQNRIFEHVFELFHSNKMVNSKHQTLF